MGLLSKLFKKKNKDEIPPSTWLPTPPPVTDYDQHTPREETTTVKPSKSNINKSVQNKKEPDLSHLDKNGELPWGWIYANREFIAKVEDQNRYFTDSYSNACKSLDVKKRYAALKSQVLFWNDAKKICKSKGECFEKWFSDIIANDDLINQKTTELKYIEDNIGNLLKLAELKKNMRSDIIALVTDNDGILQTDIYKMYPEELKDFVVEQIAFLCHDKIIIKEKSGRTYALHLIESKSLPSAN
jgi:hypothetical protein|nr:MAG TPA: hypothetical protein [Caudoviricetes sp.]